MRTRHYSRHALITVAVRYLAGIVCHGAYHGRVIPVKRRTTKVDRSFSSENPETETLFRPTWRAVREGSLNERQSVKRYATDNVLKIDGRSAARSAKGGSANNVGSDDTKFLEEYHCIIIEVDAIKLVERMTNDSADETFTSRPSDCAFSPRIDLDDVAD